MGRRAKIALLPESVRSELNRRLIGSAFSGFEGLSEWLSEQGFVISRGAVQRYAQSFQEKLDKIKLATEQAREVVAASADREGSLSDALMALVQREIFSVLTECKGNIEKGELAKIARSVADLARATVRQKQWREEITERLRKQQAVAEQKINQVAERRGLSPETYNEIRSILLGIDPVGATI